ncbi:bifunctional P-loop containing nucleoside triphosphate hydrolase/GTP binding domain [Babesia duncani]|uniref:Bifunctional P-loop containing nucleoside triphosphate hydrolase/GTP binding domain n=1 Tax=Babesia duncani TaxID=323732 RepID=A0AAD9UQ03_9APIC|nr:bifunctional P-loop containing nucleoside triphosphate hydrolase/GTP binding domain [Babesia duncani]
MYYTRQLFNALINNAKTEKVPFASGILKEVIEKAMGTPLLMKCNFFRQTNVTWRDPIGSPGTIVLVDLPGYGYSTAKEDSSINWNELTLSYLKHRETLRLVVILADSRVGLKKSDLEVINICSKYKVKWQVVLSKCDHVKPVELAKAIQKARLMVTNFKGSHSPVIAASATKNQNLDQLRGIIDPFRIEKGLARMISRQLKENAKANMWNKSSQTDAKATASTMKESQSNDLMVNRTKLVQVLPENSLQGYNLRRHLTKPKDPYTPDHIALECLCEVFDRIKAPEGFVDQLHELAPMGPICIQQEIELPTEPTFMSIDGSLMCTMDIEACKIDNLATSTTSVPKSENLIQEKISSFQRKLDSGMLVAHTLQRPKLGTSYKRVLSLFQPKKRKVSNEPKEQKGTWNKVYIKWQRWSRKHPELAASVGAPTKAQVTKESRKQKVRKQQLRLYRERLAAQKQHVQTNE